MIGSVSHARAGACDGCTAARKRQKALWRSRRLRSRAALLGGDASALLLRAQLGCERLTKIVHLEDWSDFDFARFGMGIGAAFQPVDGFLHRFHLPKPVTGDQLLGLREWTVDHT